MWRFYIELFKDDCYGEYVESAETPDGLPVCCDLNVAKFFYNVCLRLKSWKEKLKIGVINQVLIYGLMSIRNAKES